MGPRELGGLGNPLVGNVADSRRPHLCQSMVTVQWVTAPCNRRERSGQFLGSGLL